MSGEPLQDGGTVRFECNCCGKALLDFQITRPNLIISGEKFQGQYKCTCPFCGGFSDVKTIVGGFAIVCIADVIDEENDKEKLLTFWTDTYYEDDGTEVIIVKKA